MKFSHLLDIAFTLENEEKDPLDSDRAVILQALNRRVEYLRTCSPEEFREAIGHCDSYSFRTKTFYVVVMPDGKILSDAKFGPCLYSNTVEATKKKRRFNGVRVEKYNPKKHGE